ncbi:hypothetical protein HXX76_007039 [Chlamydomonas incerta]|uniref:Uncharacterized protein n=1 Tax=Chlamydomonas incerta TaxID=51695 RepID=A0A835T8P4_CHLIN|nr:hypothetical protein HXX76_007039 [Chlamydomonas incerta]|eukprot:KAG2435844.1 hypothetical protein HXX76_007039 [Chlamydomonas incerta]
MRSRSDTNPLDVVQKDVPLPLGGEAAGLLLRVLPKHYRDAPAELQSLYASAANLLKGAYKRHGKVVAAYVYSRPSDDGTVKPGVADPVRTVLLLSKELELQACACVAALKGEGRLLVIVHASTSPKFVRVLLLALARVAAEEAKQPYLLAVAQENENEFLAPLGFKHPRSQGALKVTYVDLAAATVKADAYLGSGARVWALDCRDVVPLLGQQLAALLGPGAAAASPTTTTTAAAAAAAAAATPNHASDPAASSRGGSATAVPSAGTAKRLLNTKQLAATGHGVCANGKNLSAGGTAGAGKGQGKAGAANNAGAAATKAAASRPHRKQGGAGKKIASPAATSSSDTSNTSESGDSTSSSGGDSSGSDGSSSGGGSSSSSSGGSGSSSSGSSDGGSSDSEAEDGEEHGGGVAAATAANGVLGAGRGAAGRGGRMGHGAGNSSSSNSSSSSSSGGESSSDIDGSDGEKGDDRGGAHGAGGANGPAAEAAGTRAPAVATPGKANSLHNGKTQQHAGQRPPPATPLVNGKRPNIPKNGLLPSPADGGARISSLVFAGRVSAAPAPQPEAGSGRPLKRARVTPAAPGGETGGAGAGQTGAVAAAAGTGAVAAGGSGYGPTQVLTKTEPGATAAVVTAACEAAPAADAAAAAAAAAPALPAGALTLRQRVRMLVPQLGQPHQGGRWRRPAGAAAAGAAARPQSLAAPERPPPGSLACRLVAGLALFGLNPLLAEPAAAATPAAATAAVKGQAAAARGQAGAGATATGRGASSDAKAEAREEAGGGGVGATGAAGAAAPMEVDAPLAAGPAPAAATAAATTAGPTGTAGASAAAGGVHAAAGGGGAVVAGSAAAALEGGAASASGLSAGLAASPGGGVHPNRPAAAAARPEATAVSPPGLGPAPPRPTAAPLAPSAAGQGPAGGGGSAVRRLAGRVSALVVELLRSLDHLDEAGAEQVLAMLPSSLQLHAAAGPNAAHTERADLPAADPSLPAAPTKSEACAPTANANGDGNRDACAPAAQPPHPPPHLAAASAAASAAPPITPPAAPAAHVSGSALLRPRASSATPAMQSLPHAADAAACASRHVEPPSAAPPPPRLPAPQAPPRRLLVAASASGIAATMLQMAAAAKRAAEHAQRTREAKAAAAASAAAAAAAAAAETAAAAAGAARAASALTSPQATRATHSLRHVPSLFWRREDDLAQGPAAVAAGGPAASLPAGARNGRAAAVAAGQNWRIALGIGAPPKKPGPKPHQPPSLPQSPKYQQLRQHRGLLSEQAELAAAGLGALPDEAGGSDAEGGGATDGAVARRLNGVLSTAAQGAARGRQRKLLASQIAQVRARQQQQSQHPPSSGIPLEGRNGQEQGRRHDAAAGGAGAGEAAQPPLDGPDLPTLAHLSPSPAAAPAGPATAPEPPAARLARAPNGTASVASGRASALGGAGAGPHASTAVTTTTSNSSPTTTTTTGDTGGEPTARRPRSSTPPRVRAKDMIYRPEGWNYGAKLYPPRESLMTEAGWRAMADAAVSWLQDQEPGVWVHSQAFLDGMSERFAQQYPSTAPAAPPAAAAAAAAVAIGAAAGGAAAAAGASAGAAPEGAASRAQVAAASEAANARCGGNEPAPAGAVCASIAHTAAQGAAATSQPAAAAATVAAAARPSGAAGTGAAAAAAAGGATAAALGSGPEAEAAAAAPAPGSAAAAPAAAVAVAAAGGGGGAAFGTRRPKAWEWEALLEQLANSKGLTARGGEVQRVFHDHYYCHFFRMKPTNPTTAAPEAADKLAPAAAITRIRLRGAAAAAASAARAAAKTSKAAAGGSDRRPKPQPQPAGWLGPRPPPPPGFSGTSWAIPSSTPGSPDDPFLGPPLKRHAGGGSTGAAGAAAGLMPPPPGARAVGPGPAAALAPPPVPPRPAAAQLLQAQLQVASAAAAAAAAATALCDAAEDALITGPSHSRSHLSTSLFPGPPDGLPNGAVTLAPGSASNAGRLPFGAAAAAAAAAPAAAGGAGKAGRASREATASGSAADALGGAAPSMLFGEVTLEGFLGNMQRARQPLAAAAAAAAWLGAGAGAGAAAGDDASQLLRYGTAGGGSAAAAAAAGALLQRHQQQQLEEMSLFAPHFLFSPRVDAGLLSTQLLGADTDAGLSPLGFPTSTGGRGAAAAAAAAAAVGAGAGTGAGDASLRDVLAAAGVAHDALDLGGLVGGSLPPPRGANGAVAGIDALVSLRAAPGSGSAVAAAAAAAAVVVGGAGRAGAGAGRGRLDLAEVARSVAAVVAAPPVGAALLMAQPMVMDLNNGYYYRAKVLEAAGERVHLEFVGFDEPSFWRDSGDPTIWWGPSEGEVAAHLPSHLQRYRMNWKCVSRSDGSWVPKPWCEPFKGLGVAQVAEALLVADQPPARQSGGGSDGAGGGGGGSGSHKRPRPTSTSRSPPPLLGPLAAAGATAGGAGGTAHLGAGGATTAGGAAGGRKRAGGAAAAAAEFEQMKQRLRELLPAQTTQTAQQRGGVLACGLGGGDIGDLDLGLGAGMDVGVGLRGLSSTFGLGLAPTAAMLSNQQQPKNAAAGISPAAVASASSGAAEARVPAAEKP